MKYIVVYLTLFLSVSCHKKVDEVEKKVLISGKSWHTNMTTALTLSKQEKKNLLVMVSEDYCRWCLKMEKETLTQEDIQKKLDEYILVSIRRSDKKSLKHLNEFDGNIPSFFFIDNQSDFVESIIGYYEPSIFMEYLKEIENDRE